VDVSFVFTNPRHHVEMMAPVARELQRRGASCQLVSLAELRGFRTPDVDGVRVRRVIPVHIRRAPKVGAGDRRAGARSGLSGARRLAQRAVAAALIPLTRLVIGRSRVVVIPNDSVFPYVELMAAIGRRAACVLMQEGIRFDSPDGDRYGTGGGVVCAWGAGSAELFARRGVPQDRIEVTGAPRLDTLDPAAWHSRGQALLAELGLARAPIAFLSNPIENQGFGTLADKLALFERFLGEVAPLLRDQDRHVIVKNHLHEDPDDFARVAASSPAASHVVVPRAAPVFAAIAASAGAVVLSSTIGLESMIFGVPVAALEIPGHGFAFEYVSHGGAIGLRRDAIADGVRALLSPDPQSADRARAFIARHLHDRGRATGHVADVISRELARRH
jgi:hypothetical protein